MGHLVDLPAGRLEQDCRSHPSVNATQSALGVRVQGLTVGGLTGEIRIYGNVETGLTQLTQHHGAELRYVKRG